MRKIPSSFYSSLIISIVLLSSCNSGSNVPPKVDSTFTPVKVDTIAISFKPVLPDEKDTSIRTNGFVFLNNKGLKDTKKFWNKVCNDCKVQGDDFRLKDFFFLGAGNPLYIGSIVASDGTISKIPLDSNILSYDEIQKVIARGGVSPCQSALSTKLVLSAIFNGSINIGNMDSALGVMINAALQKNKAIDFKLGGWQKMEINTTWLANVLQTGGNLDHKKLYMNAMLTPGNLIIAKAIYINGFMINMGFSDSLSIAIQAALKKNPEISFGNLSANLSYNSARNKTIIISCTQPFVLYGYLMSGRKVN